MFLLTAIALLVAQARTFHIPPRTADTLGKYLDSMHWNPSTSGPLIAVDADEIERDRGGASGFEGFQRKKVKVGMLSVVAPVWDVVLDESRLPNAFQELSHEEKLYFLLATISQADLQKLTGDGLALSDLSGQQREALLSMIPNPVTYQNMVGDGGGARGVGGETLPPAASEWVRLQLRGGAEIRFRAASTPDVYPGTSLSSFDDRPRQGVRFTKLNDPENPPYPEQVVESAEKQSELSWSDARLKPPVDLQSRSTVGDLVSEVRKKTGIEVYVDARVAHLEVQSYGDSASAGDLLRGLAISLDGVYRRVGPAYVLASDLEGEATRSATLMMRSELGHRQLRTTIAQWSNAIVKRQITESVGLASDDLLQAAGIPDRDFCSESEDDGEGWVSSAELPGGTRASLYQWLQDNRQPDSPPVGQDLKGSVRITRVYAIRLVLPNGLPLPYESVTLPNAPNPNEPMDSDDSTGDKKTPKPKNVVVIQSDDPSTITKFCTALKELGIPELWIDSQDRRAIQAAIDSGLSVGLVVEPWKPLNGEVCKAPDRNLLGQTGGQLQKFADSTAGLLGQRPQPDADAFAPGSRQLDQHFHLLLANISAAGISRVVLMSAFPDGYAAATAPDSDDPNAEAHGGFETFGGPEDPLAYLYEFGYTGDLRLQFLRRFHMDPVDIVPFGWQPALAHPFFEWTGRSLSRLGVKFPQPDLGAEYYMRGRWQNLRFTMVRSKLNELLRALKPLCESIYVEQPPDIWPALPYLTNGMLSDVPPIPETSKIQLVSLISFQVEKDDENVAPLSTWDSFTPPSSLWDSDSPACFDLRYVPSNEWLAYLKALLKP